jgi:hypothetical protein
MRATLKIDTHTSVVPHSLALGRPATICLGEGAQGCANRDRFYDQVYRKDQQLPLDLTPLLRLHRVALLQGVEPA